MKQLKRSPWGLIDGWDEICPGIYSVSTSSHGGIKLDRAHQARMPESFRGTLYSGSGWYEEDCDWCLPFTVFQAEILAGGNECAKKQILDGSHTKTLRNWLPDLFEEWFQTTIAPGNSYIKDERTKQAG